MEAAGRARHDPRVDLRRNELVILLLAIGLAWGGAGVAAKRLAGRSEGPREPKPKVVSTIPAGTSPLAIAVGEGFVWAVVGEGLARIDPASHEVTPFDPAPEAVLLPAPTAVAIGPCAVWEAHAFFREIGEPPKPVGFGAAAVQEFEPTGEWALVRMNPDSGAVEAQARFRDGFPNAIAVAGDAVWVVSGDEDAGSGRVTRVEARSAKVVATIPVRADARDVVVTPDAVWVSAGGAGADTNTVLRIDPRTNRIAARIGVQTPPGRLAVGGGLVWVVTELYGGRIMMIDPSSNRVVDEIVILHSAGIAYALGRVWVTTAAGGRITWIEPRTLKEGRPARVGRSAGAIAVDEDGTAWVADFERDRVVRVDLFGREGGRSRKPARKPCSAPSPPVAAGGPR